MVSFTQQVPPAVRVASTWDADYAAFQAPDGRWWRYTDDPRAEGVSWRADGQPVCAAVWCDDDD